MNNPYWGKSFSEFFVILWRRMTGSLPLAELPPDELQLLALIGICASTTVLGTLLTLKKMTLLANSISHTILLGIVITCIATLSTGSDLTINLSTLFQAALISAIGTGILTAALTHVTKIQEDASIGLAFTTLFSIGIILVTVFTRSLHIGTESIMGNLDAIHVHDLQLIFLAAAINWAITTLFYHPLIVTAFDPFFAQGSGISVFWYNQILLFACSITVITAFRAVGVILVLTFLVTPTLTARLWTSRIRSLIFLSVICGLVSAVLGIALSRHSLSVWNLPVSTSALVSTCMGALYLICIAFKKKPACTFNQS